MNKQQREEREIKEKKKKNDVCLGRESIFSVRDVLVDVSSEIRKSGHDGGGVDVVAE